MKDIPLNAKVECVDGPCGQSTRVIVDPKTLRVTHFVVRQAATGQTQHLVPVDQVVETTSGVIRLRCTRDELGKMKQFIVTEYRQVEVPRYAGVDTAVPYYSPDIETLPVDRELIPEGELAIQPDTRVEATDGPVGQIDELVTNPETGQITHLALRRGHMWGKKDVLLPVSLVKYVAEGTVYLTIDKETISTLLAVPARWHSGVADVQLVVAVFDETGKARAALRTTKETVKKDKLGVLNTAVLAKDQDGNPSIMESEDVDPKHGTLFGAVTGGLVGLLGGPVGVVVGAAAGAAAGRVAAGRIDMGFPDEYLSKLEESLQPGSSALVALVEGESVQKVSQLLTGMEGEVLHLALTDDVLSQITGGTEA
jgi:uncharacterized membrane protein